MVSSFAAFVALARPAQWIKNGFVLVGLFFAHAWNDPVLSHAALLCFAGFCLVSSAVYSFNDIMDREADRVHAEKHTRPVASGAIGVRAATVFATLLLFAGLALAALAAQDAFLIVFTYAVLNLGYSLGLKHIPLLDVVIIASGFMLRILAGTLGIGIAPSDWLLLCGFMLTLFLGFAKRRAELSALVAARLRYEPSEQAVPEARRVLSGYSLAFLDRAIAVCAAAAVLAYAWYTLDPRTIALHGTASLVLTVPFVLYGMGRYLWLLYRQGRGEDPSSELLRDPHLIAAVTGWLVVAAILLR
jgi:4-hydroxybenzoate polyprenyltransferase